MADATGPGSAHWVTNRKKRRMPCQLWVGAREHSALVLDLSPSGLFIQTHAKAQRGEKLPLKLPHEDVVMELVVEVVRTKQVPQNMLAAAKGGIGVRIANAPEEYYDLLASIGIDERSKPRFELEREPGPRFRIYVAQIGGPRSRRVELAAPDAETAGARALAELGGGWRVLRVEPV
jgi:PilZ domain